MLNSDKEFLSFFGWDDFFESQILDTTLFPARVISEERGLYRVQAGFQKILLAAISGKMNSDADARADYPAVGDWVMVEIPPQMDRGIIYQVLPRKTIVHRKQVLAADMQILSTNVDYVFITIAAGADLNLRRLERYLSVVHDSGSQPVILLTKADTCSENLSEIIASVQTGFPGIPVHALSKNDFASAEFFKTYLKKGTTSVFIGSSGVGKSTLVNFLVGDDQIKTQEVREGDGKGRHTTTSRNLYVSRYDGLIIDTPGMREIQLSDHAEGVKDQFADIQKLIGECRFSDCQHQTEPDCAVKKALADHSLAEDRWKSYLKLKAEARHQVLKQRKTPASADRNKWKKNKH